MPDYTTSSNSEPFTHQEYYDENKSMLELVFAPCSPIAGGNVNWISKSDEEIIDATMGELERLFPTEVRVGEGEAQGEVCECVFVCEAEVRAGVRG